MDENPYVSGGDTNTTFFAIVSMMNSCLFSQIEIFRENAVAYIQMKVGF